MNTKTKQKESVAGQLLEETKGQDLATQGSRPPAVQAHDPMAIIATAVEKGIAADELSRLLDLQQRYQSDQARQAFNRALSDFQSMVPKVKKVGRASIKAKSGGSFTYSFPPLEKIMDTIKPHMTRCGLSISFTDFDLLTEGNRSQVKLACLIRHRDGHIEPHPITLPVDQALVVNDMQKIGIVISYAKRYALVGALALVGTDDDVDGNLPEVECVTDQQLVVLRDYIQETEATESGLCKLLGVPQLEMLPAADYEKAKTALKNRAARMAAAEGGAA